MPYPRFASLRLRLLLITMLAIVPALSLNLFDSLRHRNESLASAREEIQRLAGEIAADQASILDNSQVVLAALARLPELDDPNEAVCSATLARLLGELQIYGGLVAVRTDGTLYCSAPPLAQPTNISDRDYFQRALSSRKFSSSDYLISRITGQPTISLLYPSYDSNGALQVLISAGLRINRLNARVAAFPVPEGVVITIIDRQGQVLIRQPNPSGRTGIPAAEAALLAQSNGQRLLETNGPDGKPWLYAIAPLSVQDDYGATVIVGIPTTLALAEANQSMVLALLSLTLAVVLAILAIWYGGSILIVRPVQALARAAERLATGDLTARSGITPSAGEIGRLAGVFDTMAGALEQRTSALRASEARFRLLAENAQDIIYRVRLGPPPQWEYISPAVNRILGYTPEQYYQNPDFFLSTVHADDRNAVEQALLHIDQQPDMVAFRWLRHDQSICWIEVRNTIIRDSNGNPIAAEGMARDITQRMLAEERRQVFERKLQETQRLESLGMLAGGIAHDFNNLLVAILGNAGLALEELAPESPAREGLTQIEIAARRAADLTRQMLAYAGKGRFVVQPLDMNALVDETAHLFQASIPKRVSLRYSLADNLPAIEADATQMRQVVMNLVVNAAEAIGSNRSGIITIMTGSQSVDRRYLTETYLDPDLPEGRYVFVEVTDNGRGIDAATKSKIFEPFFTTKFTGRGLGLAAVLGIVRGHRGAIKVYSEAGRGTTFKVLFPATGAHATLTSTQVTPPPWRGQGLVLLIDDEPDVRLVGTRMLQRIGFTVLTAADGQLGLDILRQHGNTITCILLDMTMPHLSGEETFRLIRQISPTVPVILISGYNEQEIISQFAGRGLAGFLQKPFTPADLRQVLQHVLEH